MTLDGTGIGELQRATDTDGRVLSKARELFEALEDDGIRYCHWKSNEHLLAGAAGRTDLDVLVDREQAREARRTLAEVGFERLRDPPLGGVPGMEDYLGFDRETGTLLHVHLHYELVLGGHRLKSYRLPLEDAVLSRRRRDPETGIYTSDPELELLLLLVRYGLKFRRRDLLPWREFPGEEFTAEFEWLLERVDTAAVVSLADRYFTRRVAETVRLMVERGATKRRFRALDRRLAAELSEHRRYGAIEAPIRSLARTARLGLVLLARTYALPRAFGRTAPAGGTFIAFIGADGAGKSTMAERTTEWLRWKMDVLPVYFGSGDGPASPLRWPLIRAKSLLSDGDGDTAANSGGADERRPLHRRLGRVLWALALGREKRKKLERAWRGRDRGLVVVSDRYPQHQEMGINDGPLLSEWKTAASKLKRWLARYEAKPYRRADRQEPDLVIELSVSADEAEERVSDTDRARIERKIDVVESLEFDSSRVVRIDADRPLEEVERDVKRAVWESL